MDRRRALTIAATAALTVSAGTMAFAANLGLLAHAQSEPVGKLNAKNVAELLDPGQGTKTPSVGLVVGAPASTAIGSAPGPTGGSAPTPPPVAGSGPVEAPVSPAADTPTTRADRPESAPAKAEPADQPSTEPRDDHGAKSSAPPPSRDAESRDDRPAATTTSVSTPADTTTSLPVSTTDTTRPVSTTATTARHAPEPGEPTTTEPADDHDD